MRHIALFAGIHGFKGFDDAGMETVAFVEIDKQCQRVLQRHYPDVLLLDDVRTSGRHNLPDADIISFGSPCQDLSIAGNQDGIYGERSKLFFEAIRIVKELKPAFAVWENVANALRSNAGRDFAAVLNAFRECGARDIAWRTLDAQYGGVPQRRRRIILVADFRGERAGEILFEPEGDLGGFTPRKQTREAAAPVSGTLSASGSGTARTGNARNELDMLVTPFSYQAIGQYTDTDVASTIMARDYKSAKDLICLTPDETQHRRIYGIDGLSPTLAATNGKSGSPTIFLTNTKTGYPAISGTTSPTIRSVGNGSQIPAVALRYIVRRLTPRECERLMGFQSEGKSVIIEVCSDHQKNCVHAEILSHRLLKPVGNVERNGLSSTVECAATNLSQSCLENNKPALSHVQIHCEETAVRISSQEKCYLSANFAEGRNLFPHPVRDDVFALLVAGLNTIAAQITPNGREELPANAPHSTHLKNGNWRVELSGSVITPHVNGAELDSIINKGLLKSITSNPFDISITAPILTTLFSSVLSAINGYIPSEILSSSSFKIEITSNFGWTFPLSDTARYSMLGNSFVVNESLWLGWRVMKVMGS